VLRLERNLDIQDFWAVMSFIGADTLMSTMVTDMAPFWLAAECMNETVVSDWHRQPVCRQGNDHKWTLCAYRAARELDMSHLVLAAWVVGRHSMRNWKSWRIEHRP
jgi:hypothetical protein